jgi:lipopolysaccharide export system protein LptA
VRLTIERLRTLVLVAGVVLVASLAAFLILGRGKNLFKGIEIPKKLGIDIQQEANGYTITRSSHGHTLFRIHASKVVQMKDNHALLHDVKIELYGADGSRVDRIEGNEFEYDQQAETAKANGPVEITLMRPGEAPAIAPRATPAQAVADKAKTTALAGAAENAAQGEIHVKTSGLVFDQKSGVATTTQHADFSMTQGTGNSQGASYDSQQGHLVLDRAVVLNLKRGADTVMVHAGHAEFERTGLVCRLRAATANYRNGQATATEARILFRQDGSAVRLDATDGLAIQTAQGGNLSAPTGFIEFNEHNQPRHGHLEGGVTMGSQKQAPGVSRQVHGASPSAELEFTPTGDLSHAHLERGVEFTTEQETQSQSPGQTRAEPLHVTRHWRSPVAEIDFRETGKGQVEPATIHGAGGVVITGESQRGNGVRVPSKLIADDVTGELGPGSALTEMTGTGHASLEETSAVGTHQTASGDRLKVHFAAGEANPEPKRNPAGSPATSQIESATLQGSVLMVREPAPKPGEAAPTPMRATAGRAEYEGAGEWLHLTENPRVDSGGLQLAADKIDISQATGQAFAHGNVKSTWFNTSASGTAQSKSPTGAPSSQSSSTQTSAALGGQGPSHVISSEAEFNQATGEAIFRGQARLWQDANSVAAPVIVLDRQRQTLVARTTSPADPVRAVLVSASGLDPGSAQSSGAAPKMDSSAKPESPSVVRVRGGDLRYSDAERKAVVHSGVVGAVTAETATATTTSNEVELILLPPGNHAGKDGAQAQVDRLTARGRVVVTSQDRRGTGEQLVYTSETGEYVLTGSAATPPRMTDPLRGNVSGEALIFNGRDDSVSVEGGGRKTTTETRTPK